MDLYLIRHAQAAERGARYPDDTLRPLVAKGEAQAVLLAEALTRQGVYFTRLATSPWLRARQTAEPLRVLAGGELVLLDALAQGDPTESAAALRALAAESRSSAALQRASGRAGASGAAAAELMKGVRLAAIGHEPWLSMLASWLLSGRTHGVAVTFRKAAVMTLAGEPRAGGMSLLSFLPMRVVKALRGPDGGS